MLFGWQQILHLWILTFTIYNGQQMIKSLALGFVKMALGIC